MTMYCIAGLSMMHMLLHVESECDIHVITRGRMWRNNSAIVAEIHVFFIYFEVHCTRSTCITHP